MEQPFVFRKLEKKKKRDMKRELIEFMENYSSIAVIKKVLENYLSHRDKLIHDWDKKYVFVTGTDITKIDKYDIDRNNDIPNNKKKVFGLSQQSK